MKILRRTVEALGVALVLFAILLLAFMFISHRFGWQAYPVMSGSMEPELKIGGIILTAPEELGDITVGDAITYETGGSYKVTHRVVKIVEIEGLLYFQTKGDANEEPDPSLVSAKGDKMEKVVFHIPYLGFVAQFMKSGYAFPALVGIPAIVLTIISIRDIKHGIREIRRKRKVNTVGVK